MHACTVSMAAYEIPSLPGDDLDRDLFLNTLLMIPRIISERLKATLL